MPRIFDNIDQHLLPALTKTLEVSQRADFSVGYFNLRGWKELDKYIEPWAGREGACCRLLIGMHRAPSDELRDAFSLVGGREISMPQATRLKHKLAEEFREQLMLGTPTNEDEEGLRRLARQLREKRLFVKLFLRHPLHAKLYLIFRDDYNNPISGYLGSSNLTLSGLSYQGELNVDVLDHDACDKLSKWFDDRWNDTFCLDISQELIEVIEESWAREVPPTPYQVYLKIAFHLAQEARSGLSEFKLPTEFQKKLFKFQSRAVRIGARHLNTRRGVIIGDVVGLGKTLMATAMARVFQEDHGASTLIICPVRIVKMWQSYVDQYGLSAKIIPYSKVVREIREVPARFRLIIIDESHNLRNRERKDYKAIKDFLDQSDSIHCILLSATPYNKTYLDLSAQLRLFVPEDADLGVRPEQMLRQLSEIQVAQIQVPLNSIAAFEKSEHTDDWREMLKLYMVRRTRSFIKTHYAIPDENDPKRKYLLMDNNERRYFPDRIPKTLKFTLDQSAPDDKYARLYSSQVVDVIDNLDLPRYGLGNYLNPKAEEIADANERRILENLSRAGKRLLGYCRTNLFKRLESSGQAFIESMDRHVLRNYVFLYALENNLPLPIGTQDVGALNPALNDEDSDAAQDEMSFDEDGESQPVEETASVFTAKQYRERARDVYQRYRKSYVTRFQWMRPQLLRRALAEDLERDSAQLIAVLQTNGAWDSNRDRKLKRLLDLITKDHPRDKVLVFTQFADTVRYLTGELEKRGVTSIAAASGRTDDPTEIAWRFSPKSNEKKISPDQELRVLISTDILSEGQNLQDCHIVVNYDLPWAIIRLTQRAGRVDRIGQEAQEISCYSFLPADGVEEIIHLRSRVRQRLQENGEVVGTDEEFFEDERNNQQIRDLYAEKPDALNDESEGDVDLGSEAFQIWDDATKSNPQLAKLIADMPDVVFSTRPHQGTPEKPEGVLVYARTREGADALAWIDKHGSTVTRSQLAILRAAACEPVTPTIPRHPSHHALVRRAVEAIIQETKSAGSSLGPKYGARYKTYVRLKAYHDGLQGSAPLLIPEDLARVLDALINPRHKLLETARDTLNRQFKADINDEDLAALVINMMKDNRLYKVEESDDMPDDEPHIICSLGLFSQ